MEEKLINLIEHNLDKFPGWLAIINDNRLMMSSDKKVSQDERSKVTLETARVLAQIAEFYFEYGGFNGVFDTSEMNLHPNGPDLIIRSKKTGIEFCLALDHQGIYLQTSLKHPGNLPRMEASFYQDLITLSDLGAFKILESEPRHADRTEERYGLQDNSRNKISSLLKNYIFGTAEGEQNFLSGNLRIRWSYETSFYDIIYHSSLAFKLLCKLTGDPCC